MFLYPTLFCCCFYTASELAYTSCERIIHSNHYTIYSLKTGDWTLPHLAKNLAFLMELVITQWSSLCNKNFTVFLILISFVLPWPSFCHPHSISSRSDMTCSHPAHCRQGASMYPKTHWHSIPCRTGCRSC